MIDEEISERAKTALRDYSADARIENVWQRLDAEFRRPERRPRASLWLVPVAAGVMLFGLGVFVGRHSIAPAPTPIAEVSAEPAQPTLPAAATEEPQSLAARATPAPAPTVADRRRPAPARAPAPVTSPSEEEALSGFGVAPSPSSSVASGPPEWLQRADAGEFKAARAALDRVGGWDVAIATASPDQLMTLVDVARASGERDPAVRALRRLLTVHADAPEAPLAAWTLGNVLEQGGDRSGAAEAYALYRRLSPAGDFAEDAAAREVDVALSAGNYDAALQLVEQYAKDFPAGRRVSEFREELQKLEAARNDSVKAVASDSAAAAPDAAPSAANPSASAAPPAAAPPTSSARAPEPAP